MMHARVRGHPRRHCRECCTGRLACDHAALPCVTRSLGAAVRVLAAMMIATFADCGAGKQQLLSVAAASPAACAARDCGATPAGGKRTKSG